MDMILLITFNEKSAEALNSLYKKELDHAAGNPAAVSFLCFAFYLTNLSFNILSFKNVSFANPPTGQDGNNHPFL